MQAIWEIQQVQVAVWHMKEEFIAYLWKNRLIRQEGIFTTDGGAVAIIDPGTENRDAGPDFTTSRIRIDDTLWVGHAEIHIRSSDWFRHKHHFDPAYDNTILHVVYEHDEMAVSTKEEAIPTLEVKHLFNSNLLANYTKLRSATSWVPCQRSLKHVGSFHYETWLTRLLVERFERKVSEIRQYLQSFAFDWERTFYFFLARNFGFRVNAVPFGLVMQKTPLQVLLKHRDQLHILEAILFGQAGLLPESVACDYEQNLKEEYLYRQKTLGLSPVSSAIWKFGRLRPANFPTIRIAQFAMLIHKRDKLFEWITIQQDKNKFLQQFRVRASNYWDTHYRFGSVSDACPKVLGEEAIFNIMINTIAPFMFLYGKESMKPGLTSSAIDLMHAIPPESNQLIHRWKELGMVAQSAADSQALIELKKWYCTARRCLQCQIGFHVLRS